jgi:hypothetical protein
MAQPLAARPKRGIQWRAKPNPQKSYGQSPLNPENGTAIRYKARITHWGNKKGTLAGPCSRSRDRFRADDQTRAAMA